MLVSNCFLRFSWKARPEPLEECVARLKRFLSAITTLYPSCNIVRYNNEGSPVALKPNSRRIKEILLRGIAFAEADSRPIDEIGYTITICVELDNAQLPFHISCGSVSQYVDNVISCSLPSGR